MFTKAQRLELGALSLKVFGSDSYWQKIWKKQRVPDGTYTTEQTRYMRLKNGQLITAETAMQRGLLSMTTVGAAGDGGPKPTPKTQSAVKMVYRQATFDEMKHALESGLETREFSAMPEVQIILTAAMKYLKGTLLNIPFLVVGENGEADFAELLALLPEEKRAALAERKVPNGNPNLFCIDGVQFLSDVVFAHMQPEKAAELLEAYANPSLDEIPAGTEVVHATPEQVNEATDRVLAEHADTMERLRAAGD